MHIKHSLVLSTILHTPFYQSILPENEFESKRRVNYYVFFRFNFFIFRKFIPIGLENMVTPKKQVKVPKNIVKIKY